MDTGNLIITAQSKNIISDLFQQSSNTLIDWSWDKRQGYAYCMNICSTLYDLQRKFCDANAFGTHLTISKFSCNIYSFIIVSIWNRVSCTALQKSNFIHLEIKKKLIRKNSFTFVFSQIVVYLFVNVQVTACLLEQTQCNLIQFRI